MEKEMEKEKNIMIKLKFDGEYLNGERNGKGKEYNKDGKLVVKMIIFHKKKT